MKSLEYYNNKYALSGDPILSLKYFITIDERVNHFKKSLDNGNYRDLEFNDFQKAISNIQLIPTVPKDVCTVFEGAKKLYVFGFFEYYFLTISQHYIYLAVESALRNKYNKSIGRPKNFINMKIIINKLITVGVIKEEDKKTYESIIILRNSLSHLTNYILLPPSSKVIKTNAVLINQLYDS